jgi:hypothetical protein
MKELAPVIVILSLFVIAIMTGAVIGGSISEGWHENDLRKRGLKQYNQQTGDLEWKVGAVVKE